MHHEKTLIERNIQVKKDSVNEQIQVDCNHLKEAIKDPINQSLSLLTAVLDFWRDPENQKMLSKSHYLGKWNEMGSKKNLVLKRQKDLLKIFKTEIHKFVDFDIQFGTVEDDDDRLNMDQDEYSSLQ